MLKVFSYGGGVQSTAALVLASQGRIDYHTFLFCNVGVDSENPATLDYVREVARPFAARSGLAFHELERVKRDGSVETIYQRMMRPESCSIGIPVYLASGALGNRNCTVEFKIRVCDRWLKEQGIRHTLDVEKRTGYSAARPLAMVGLGISLDEFQRMRNESGLEWKQLDYPLIDLQLDRMQCMQIIRAASLPVPPKSSCWFCPFHSTRTWQTLRQEQPVLFCKAVELQNEINARLVRLGKDKVWLSNKLKPLEKVTTDYQQESLFDEEAPCESGYCFV